MRCNSALVTHGSSRINSGNLKVTCSDLTVFFNTGHAKYLFTTGVVFIYQILFSLPGHMAVKLSYHSWRR